MIGLVHLVWAPLGPGPLAAFLRSYHEHPPGTDHELVILLNGAGRAGPATDARRDALLGQLGETDHRMIELDSPVIDLAAYGHAGRQLEHESLCFLNSYALIRADSWLKRLAEALARPDVGLVGASGSWESQAEWIRGRARHRPQQLLRLPRARREYPRFPNPHIRTSAFMTERSMLVDMHLERTPDKHAAYLRESGRQSVTRQVQERELRALVAGRDGRVYDTDQWPESRTYRSGNQENLLIADRRSLEWDAASPRLKARLARDAWGERAVL